MRIAIVLNTSWNVWNFRRALIRDFIKQGHQVIVVAPRDQFSERLVSLGVEFIPVRMDSRGINPFKDMALFMELLLIYVRARPDLILHYTVKPNIYGSIAAGILGIKSVPNVCGLGTLFLNPGFTTKLASRLYRFAFKFPHKVFFQNKDDQEYFVKHNLLPKKKCLQIPGSGVDIDYFRPLPRLCREDGKVQVLMISRVILDKGIREFISAAHLLKQKGWDVDFVLAGQLDPEHRRGISKAKFQEWLDWSGVKYLGFIEDLRSLINQSDVVVLPSYREGTPKSLLEAAACGKPIIATDVPGCREVVRNNYNGLLCKHKSSKDLELAIHKFLKMNKTHQRKLGENSRKIATENFSEKIIISLYNTLVSQNTNRKDDLPHRFQNRIKKQLA